MSFKVEEGQGSDNSTHIPIYLNIAFILFVHVKQVQDTTSQKKASTVSWMHYQQVLHKIGTQATERGK